MENISSRRSFDYIIVVGDRRPPTPVSVCFSHIWQHREKVWHEKIDKKTIYCFSPQIYNPFVELRISFLGWRSMSISSFANNKIQSH